MAIKFSIGFAGAAFLLAEPAMGHMAQKQPISRQISHSIYSGNLQGYMDFLQLDDLEGAPWVYSSGGVNQVRERAREEVDPAVMEEYGGYDVFPLLWTPFAENGNMLEPNEIAKRHYPCGDPRIFDDGSTISVRFSTPNNEWVPLTTYQKGQVIEMELHVRYFHKGHVEFSICDAADLEPGDVATQECFNRYPLTRAAGDDDNSPIDPNYPGRYHVPPPCTAYENGQGVNKNVNYDNDDGYQEYSVKGRYRLPENLTCTHCVLQMHYFTAHRCPHIGYDDFNPPSWPSDCAPDKDAWVTYGYREPEAICGTMTSYHSINYPEEFWNCSDIKIEADRCGPYGGIYDADSNICCAEGCGSCSWGPEGACHDRSGGTSDCCPYKVMIDAAPCSLTNPAPCKLVELVDTDDKCGPYGGIYNAHSDGDTCCAASCGICRWGLDATCHDRPGGTAACCPYKILSDSADCSATNPAPCNLPA